MKKQIPHLLIFIIGIIIGGFIVMTIDGEYPFKQMRHYVIAVTFYAFIIRKEIK